MRAAVPSLLTLLVGCAPPDVSEMFNSLAVSVSDDEAGAAESFVDAIDGAEDTLYVALPAGEDTDVADALVAAHERGVAVEVLTDWDLKDTPAIAALTEAEVPMALRDAGLKYFEFSLNEDLEFDSTKTIMAHAYVVADQKRIVAASRIGLEGDGPRVVFDLRGEDIVDDLVKEHNQMYGGTDATAVDAYDAPAKSILDTHWRYGTQSDVDLELWFGPQERLTKRVIDAVYSARSAVWILTDDLADEGLAHALQEKAKWGFDVQVIVGPAFGTSSSQLSRIFEQQTPDVVKRRLTDVSVVPTVVLIDYPEDADGYRPYTRAMVMNHDLYSAARLYRGEAVFTDQLIDAAMWTLTDVDEPSADLVVLEELFSTQRDLSVEF